MLCIRPTPNSVMCLLPMLQDAEMAAKLQVYDEVVLECTQPWLEAPGALILPHNGRMFEVKVSRLAVLYSALLTCCPWNKLLQAH